MEPCFQNIRFEISEDITLSKIFTLYKDSTALESYEWWNKSAFCYIGRMADYKGIKEILSAWEILYNKHHEKHLLYGYSEEMSMIFLLIEKQCFLMFHHL